MRPNLCKTCAFYREIAPASTRGRKRKLCMLTGEPKPTAGMRGCRFMPGEWERIDEILGLTNGNDTGNTGLPNNVKLVTAFSSNGMNVTDRHTPDDSIGFPINHTAKAEKGSLVRPGDREAPVAHVARERTRLPFVF